MLELNFDNSDMTSIKGELIYNKDIISNESIKCDSSVIIHGNVESSKNIRANYSLIVFGDIRANTISVGIDFICYGNVVCNSIEVGGDFNSFGEVTIEEQAIIQGSVLLKCGLVNDIIANGNFIATDFLEIGGQCIIDGMLISSDGINGEGKIKCETIFAKEYLEIECSTENNSKTKLYNSNEVELSSLNLENLIYSEETVNFVKKKNIINKLICENIKVSEAEYDLDYFIKILSDCAEVDEIYSEYLDIFSIIVDSEDLLKNNDLGNFLKLSYVLNRIPECMKQYNICTYVKDKKYKDIRNKISIMSFNASDKHSDFVKYLEYMEELKYFFTEYECKLLYEKLYEKIGVNSKLVFSKLK